MYEGERKSFCEIFKINEIFPIDVNKLEFYGTKIREVWPVSSLSFCKLEP